MTKSKAIIKNWHVAEKSLMPEKVKHLKKAPRKGTEYSFYEEEEKVP